MSSQALVVGSLTSDHIILEISGYRQKASKDLVEANWLKASLAVSAGAWSGKLLNASLSTKELSGFRAQVEALAKTMKGQAALEPLESYLVLKLTAGEGFIDISGVAFDQPDGHNALAFNWAMDLGHLKPLLIQLKDLEAAFPIQN